MIQRDRVDIMTGVVFSNIMLAMADTILRGSSRRVLSSANAALELAGRDCHPNFFSVSWQNDNTHEAMGEHMSKAGIKRVYLLAPNYPAGKDALQGFKRFFKGEVVAEVYTQLARPTTRPRSRRCARPEPEATYFFYPGGMGIAFVRQYAAAGLVQSVPVFGPSFSLNQTILPAIGDAAIGLYTSTCWSEKLENAANVKFVADFEATHSRIPSPYAAQAYDTATLIDATLKQPAASATRTSSARRCVPRTSRRCAALQFNRNQFPVQNYYLTQVQRKRHRRRERTARRPSSRAMPMSARAVPHES